MNTFAPHTEVKGMDAAYMTDYQYQTILKSIQMILSGCKDIPEAQAKIDQLLGTEKPKRAAAKTRAKKTAAKKTKK